MTRAEAREAARWARQQEDLGHDFDPAAAVVFDMLLHDTFVAIAEAGGHPTPKATSGFEEALARCRQQAGANWNGFEDALLAVANAHDDYVKACVLESRSVSGVIPPLAWVPGRRVSDARPPRQLRFPFMDEP